MPIHCMFDYQKTFYCPDHPKLADQYASWEVITNLYHLEKANLTKYAYKLNNNTIDPSSWGRQNVKNALNIFDYSTGAGLMAYVEKDETGKALSTGRFLELFNSMWEMFNIKTPHKGFEKRICHAAPFKSSTYSSDPSIGEILENIKWLCNREKFNSNGKLTSETFHSLILSMRSLCHS